MASEPTTTENAEKPEGAAPTEAAATPEQTSPPAGGGDQRNDRPQRRGGRGGGGGGGRGGRGGRRGQREERSDERGNIDDHMVKLYRCATVVKGGRRFSFGALVVCGDRQGRVGYGYGKANEVPPAVEKGVKQAKRAMVTVPLRGTTIPHRIMGRFGASKILLIPAREGTGVIAGSAPRAVLELAGIHDVLTKSYGSNSPKNLVKATLDGLKRLRTRDMVENLRGVKLDLPNYDSGNGKAKKDGEESAEPMDAYVSPDAK